MREKRRLHSGFGTLLAAGAVVMAIATVQPGALEAASRGISSQLPHSLAACSVGQLRVSYWGQSAAAGTAITGFDVVNTSGGPCALTGAPKLRFLTGPLSAPHPLPVVVTNGTGPGPAFSRHAAPALLQPGKPSQGGAFLVLGADWGIGGAPSCPNVSWVVFGLPGQGGSKRVPLWYPENLCGKPAAANVVSGAYPLTRMISPGLAKSGDAPRRAHPGTLWHV